MNKKRKIVMVSCIAAAVVLSGAMGWFVHQNAQAQEESKVEAQKEAQIEKDFVKVAAIQTKINLLYKDSKKEFLASNVSLKDIDEVQAELKKLEGHSFDAKVGEKINTAVMDAGYAQNMVLLEIAANKLLDAKGALVKDADIDAAQKRANELKGFKPAFTALQEQKINNAASQQAAIQTATNKVNSLFTTPAKTVVKPGVSEAAYRETKKLVDAIKQEAARTTLQKELNKVNQYLMDQEKKQVAKQEEYKQQATAEATPENNTSSPQESKKDSSSSSTSNSKGNSSSNSNKDSSSNNSTQSNSGSNNYSNSQSSSASEAQPKNNSGSSQKPSNGSKSSSGNSTGSSSQTTPKSNPKSNSGSGNTDKPGQTYEGKKNNQGSMDSDDGREWGTIDW
ncbi:toxin Cry1Ac domain D-VI-related protein [Listeria booriae]|uniref:Pesticidal crystal protein Cry1Aa domain-containing protein n=1 Tax=Listeria booriae TaxID=1552123 RepID=A0A841XZD3_9LIST|nr:toxin Cry1Ac domain D-VI-related protein [Listeria booriae]MBC1318529.1 hypothetical protein [Listeria booriae]MBC2388838.1 hypothetical protein [Listeria booriae]